MTTIEDYLDSIAASLKQARQSIAALTTEPRKPHLASGYEKACANPADRDCLGTAFGSVADAQEEIGHIQKMLEQNYGNATMLHIHTFGNRQST